MKLIYTAPVPYSSFAQRSHRFVDFFNRHTGGRTLWIDPYPGRFPQYNDLKRDHLRVYTRNDESVEVLSPPIWAAEPAMRSLFLSRIIWKPIFDRIAAFVDRSDWILVIGRPCLLALRLLQATRPSLSCYDAMDDFPQFYFGSAHTFNCQVEAAITRKVDQVLVSSTILQEKFKHQGFDAELVRNGVDANQMTVQYSSDDRRIFGYVGTLGKWFDWTLVIKMAHALPMVRFNLVGPQIVPSKMQLPANVCCIGECASKDVPGKLQGFTAGLIPFQVNRLTEAVDPIKYYEYRAAGLPVISTGFGEMCKRGLAEKVYLVDGSTNFRTLLHSIDTSPPSSYEECRRFRVKNSWQSRFEQSCFFRNVLISARRNKR